MMDALLVTTLAPQAWQDVLDHCQHLFADADPRMRMALVPRHRRGADGIARSVVQRRCDPVSMLVWEHDGRELRAKSGEFGGLDELRADLLFVGNDGAFDAVLAQDPQHALGEMKRRITGGAIQLFVLRSKSDLRELGYEDFLEALGLPFLGACR